MWSTDRLDKEWVQNEAVKNGFKYFGVHMKKNRVVINWSGKDWERSRGWGERWAILTRTTLPDWTGFKNKWIEAITTEE